jgi:hypothetical protein
VDWILKVVFPVGAPLVGIPKSEEYIDEKLLVGICRQPLLSSGMSPRLEKYGTLTLPQRSTGPFFTDSGATNDAVNIAAKPENQLLKAGVPEELGCLELT